MKIIFIFLIFLPAWRIYTLAQEFSPYAFGNLIDDEDDFNHMLSSLYPGCENLITTIISSLNKAGGDAKDKMYLLGHSDSDY